MNIELDTIELIILAIDISAFSLTTDIIVVEKILVQCSVKHTPFDIVE